MTETWTPAGVGAAIVHVRHLHRIVDMMTGAIESGDLLLFLQCETELTESLGNHTANPPEDDDALYERLSHVMHPLIYPPQVLLAMIGTAQTPLGFDQNLVKLHDAVHRPFLIDAIEWMRSPAHLAYSAERGIDPDRIRATTETMLEFVRTVKP